MDLSLSCIRWTSPQTVLGVLLLGLTGCGSQAAAPTAPLAAAPPGFWDHWGDGRAELAGYTLTQPRYGQHRRGETVLITVTEDFTARGRVKSSGAHGDEYPVLKLNEARDFQTGLYDYNVMTSVFARLDGVEPLGLPHKLTFSMQEWCGHVYEEIRPHPERLSQMTYSYFDGESVAAARHEVPAGAVVADMLPLLVRGLTGELLGPGETRAVPWLESATDRRLHHRPLTWGEATIRRGESPETKTVPAGTFTVETWTVSIEGGVTTTWWVESDAPRRLVGWERSDGEQALLTGVTRRAYWKDAAEGGEALRQELGLPQRAWPEQP